MEKKTHYHVNTKKYEYYIKDTINMFKMSISLVSFIYYKQLKTQ